jgi:hypothetical protein
MSGLGTDMVALACIVGGAAVGGFATLASQDGGHEHLDVACVEAVESPQVVVALGDGAESFVVAPNVQVHASHECHAVQEEVHVIRMREARHEMERARERVERAQERMERVRVRLERVDRQELDEARRKLEAAGLQLEGLELEGLEEVLEFEIEGRLREEMELLEKRLEGLGNGVGR